MRISEELRNKLRDTFYEQTRQMTAPLEEKRTEAINKLTEEIKQEVAEVIAGHPHIECFIKNKLGYRWGKIDIIEQIPNYIYEFISNDPAIKDIDDELNKIKNNRNTMFNTILVELTYGKDIKDIHKIFEKYNLNF